MAWLRPVGHEALTRTGPLLSSLALQGQGQALGYTDQPQTLSCRVSQAGGGFPGVSGPPGKEVSAPSSAQGLFLLCFLPIPPQA